MWVMYWAQDYLESLFHDHELISQLEHRAPEIICVGISCR